MLRVHKIELKPNNKQATYFAKACGVARFSYNWALAEWIRQYEAGEKPSEISLRKQLNAIKATQFPWMLEVTKVAPQQAIKNLGSSFQRFFTKQNKYPRFKKKGIHDAFRADNGPPAKGMDAVKLQNKKIQLPRIGWVNMHETLRFQGQILSVVISKKANRWFAAICVECDKLPHERKNHGSVGVDLGIKTFATLSNGTQYTGAKPHTAKLKRLRRLSRQLSRKKKGSRHFGKAKHKLAKLHATIGNIRRDCLHKMTTELALNFTVIGIEDLHVKGMAANRTLSRHIMDQSFYEFRRQLTYKAQWYDAEVVVINRFYPSSKQCHHCQAINRTLTLSERVWTCECGVHHDRDLNAAINIERVASTVSSTGINACGPEGAGIVASALYETMPGLKQESNIAVNFS